jgi:hypothetical protein
MMTATIASMTSVDIPEVLHTIGLRPVVAAPIATVSTIPIRYLVANNACTLCT